MATITRQDGTTITLNLGSNEAYASPVAAEISQLLAAGLPPLPADPSSQPPASTGAVILRKSGGTGMGSDVPYEVTVAYLPGPPIPGVPRSGVVNVPANGPSANALFRSTPMLTPCNSMAAAAAAAAPSSPATAMTPSHQPATSPYVPASAMT